MAAKKATEKDQRSAIRDQIVETPTASDAQVAAAVELPRELVTDVRSEMGAKHTWPKKKGAKS